MVSVVQLRSKLVRLLEDYKKLRHEDECKSEELSKVKAERIKLEVVRAKTFSELDVAERKREELEGKILDNLRKIAELQKSTSECQRATEALTHKLENQDTTSTRLQKDADDAQNQAATAAKTYAETLDRLQDLQVLQDKAEKRHEILDVNIKDLETERIALGNKLRLMKSEESQAEAKIHALEADVSALMDALNKANERAREAENTYEDLSIVLAALEEEANELKMKSDKIQEQLHVIRSSMSDN